jgi:hypothetical protein
MAKAKMYGTTPFWISYTAPAVNDIDWFALYLAVGEFEMHGYEKRE